MSKLEKFTVHLHATFTPTAEMDGGKIAVVMGEPDVTECDCKPAPGSTVAYRGGPTADPPWATFQNRGSNESDDQLKEMRNDRKEDK